MMTKWDIENSKREAVEEARAEGEAKGKAEMVKDGYKAGLGVAILSQISGFTVDKVKAILAI